MNYQKALEMVKEAVEFGAEAHYFAKGYARTNDTQQAVEIVAEDFQQASVGVEDFDMTVMEYLIARLDELEFFEEAEAFADEAEAEQAGYFWMDEVSKYLKLNF